MTPTPPGPDTASPAVPDLTTAAATSSASQPRRLLRVEARNAQVPVDRKPEWMRTKLHTGPEFKKMQALVNHEQVFTVCQEAKCPNIYECWEEREASFLIGGDTCTRRCDFCNIKTGRPGTFDADEPRRIGESVAKMQLRYATVTGVTRDDLLDEGAWLYAETIRQIHAQSPGTGVEILTPDFSGKPELLGQVFSAGPAVFAHNIETVPRIFKRIRPGFTYDGSLAVLRMAKDAGMLTKSNLILGMGEEREDITQALEDLRGAGCDLLTVTQYLRPSPKHHPIDRWVKPGEFVDIRKEALSFGFVGVMSGPLVRSSYKAGSLYRQAIESRVTADNGR